MTLTPESWLDEHGTYLYRYALTLTRDESMAEDAIQECLLAALEHQASYQGKAAERTWLTGILRHKLLDAIRREHREIPVETLNLPDGLPDDASLFDHTEHWIDQPRRWGKPEAMLESTLFWQALHYCLEHMPKRLARLFLLREMEEMDTQQICQELQISPTNVWTQLYRSRMGLRQCLDRKLGGP